MLIYKRTARAADIFHRLRKDTPYIFEVFVRENYKGPEPYDMFDISEQVRVITRGNTILLPCNMSDDELYTLLDEYCKNNPTVMVKKENEIIWEAEKDEGNRIVIK